MTPAGKLSYHTASACGAVGNTWKRLDLFPPPSVGFSQLATNEFTVVKADKAILWTHVLIPLVHLLGCLQVDK